MSQLLGMREDAQRHEEGRRDAKILHADYLHEG
jgi:hypothetical protein